MRKWSVQVLTLALSMAVLASPGASSRQAAATPAFEAYSRFDFVSGETIIAFDDFTQDAIGDFPAKWNTNASGEIVTIASRPGRWLKMTGGGVFVPDFPAVLPDNFTMEYDMLVAPSWNSGYRINTAIVELQDVKQPAPWQGVDNRFHFSTMPDGPTNSETRQAGTPTAPPSLDIKRFTKNGAPVHVSVWRQRQRVRVYFDEEKVWDVPRALLATAKYNTILFFIPNAEVKVQIVGHTDSDGDAAQNLDLSKRRAASVRAALISQFSIDGARLTTDGKGEAQPADKNETPIGKANNRRVEFIKM